MLRRRSPAERHLLLAAGLLVSLALPLLGPLVPVMPLAVLPLEDTVIPRPATPADVSAPASDSRAERALLLVGRPRESVISLAPSTGGEAPDESSSLALPLLPAAPVLIWLAGVVCLLGRRLRAELRLHALEGICWLRSTCQCPSHRRGLPFRSPRWRPCG